MNPIVGIGELLWDIFPDGRKVAGGAPFNFAFHCRQLGHDAVIVSRVGADELGRELREEVRRLGLSDEFIQTDHEHPTGTVRVTVDEQGQPAYTIAEDVAWDYIEWDNELAELSRRAAVVCLGTLAQRQPHSADTVRRLARTADGALVIFDVNLRPTVPDVVQLVWDWGRECDWFKLSLEDVHGLLDSVYIDGPDEPLDTPIRLYFHPGMDQRKLGILTLGAKGCEVIDWQKRYFERGIETRVEDTVGAGDAFTAAFLCSHLEGRSLKYTMRFALHYASTVCESHGATPRIDRDEVELRLLDDPWMRGR